MILFVCTHNAGRSVMAEAFARARGIDAMSAGTEPSSAPHDSVVETMREVGMDVSEHTGRLLTDDMIEGADLVVTMCSVDAIACPSIKTARAEHWDLPDPAGKTRADVRAIRDEIEGRVRHLAERLLASD